eukprot:5067114-Pleurochrysis_carterae.AAC.3
MAATIALVSQATTSLNLYPSPSPVRESERGAQMFARNACVAVLERIYFAVFLASFTGRLYLVLRARKSASSNSLAIAGRDVPRDVTLLFLTNG